MPGQCTTDTRTNPAHCGACNHDCGPNAQCSDSACQPVTLHPNVDAPLGIAVNSSGVFWVQSAVLNKCPKAGCGGNPSKLAQNFTRTAGQSPRNIYVDEENVWWIGRPDTASVPNEYYILKCATAGCSLSPVAHGDYAQSGPLVGNATHLFRYDGTGALYKFSKTSTSPAYLSNVYLESSFSFAVDAQYLVFTNTDPSIMGNAGVYVSDITAGNPSKTQIMEIGQQITMTGGIVYASRNANASQSNIFSCPITGCSGTGTALLANNDGVITDVLADSSGVYWAVKGDASAATGAIRRCAIPNCAGGPKDVAKNQGNPIALALDGDYVYWANSGTGSANTGSIMRVRK